jgi:hypothetical protein
MSDGNTFDHSNLGEHSHASMPSSEEFATPGRVGNEARAGYRQIPAEEEPKIYEGPDAVREAARDLGRERDASPPEPIERKVHRPDDAPPGAKYATTAREAARQLSLDHQGEDLVRAAGDLNNLAREVDNSKILLDAYNRGEITAEEARIVEARANEEARSGQPYEPEQPQPEAPQPESVEQPAPSGLSPKVQAALQDPEIRSALEQAIAPAEQARATYVSVAQEMAAATAASVLASFPELANYNAQTLPIALEIIGRENPARAAEIRVHLDRASAILQANQVAQQQQAQLRQAQLSQWAQKENAAFEKMIESEATPQRREAVKSEFQAFAKDNNLTYQQLAQIFQQNPAMNSAAFSRLVWDGLSHRAARRSAMSNPASRAAVPTVQRPGTARTRSEIAEADLGELRSQFKKATGNEQLRLAVKLHQAQRRAKG